MLVTTRTSSRQESVSKMSYLYQTSRRSLQSQANGPLAKIKVNESPAFTNTGLDYFGPLYVKNGTVRSKVGECIFTCIAVRAIHLELVEDIAAAQFLACLRRFVARRGNPDKIISDNAPQFKVFFFYQFFSSNSKWQRMLSPLRGKTL